MKMAECFQKGLLKRTTPDMENALRSLELSKSNIEDAAENMSIHRYRVVTISSYATTAIVPIFEKRMDLRRKKTY